MKCEVKKYIKTSNRKNTPKYMLQVGGLELYFKTLKEAEKYYQEYLK